MLVRGNEATATTSASFEIESTLLRSWNDRFLGFRFVIPDIFVEFSPLARLAPLPPVLRKQFAPVDQMEFRLRRLLFRPSVQTSLVFTERNKRLVGRTGEVTKVQAIPPWTLGERLCCLRRLLVEDRIDFDTSGLRDCDSRCCFCPFT